MISQGKKVCFIWGVEKPNIKYYDGKHYFCFSERDNCLGPTVQDNYFNGWYDEYFYWSRLVARHQNASENYTHSKEISSDIKRNRLGFGSIA